jgi:hypothetical protein
MVKLQEAENQIVIDSLHRLGARLGGKSFFCLFEYGRTYFTGISRASCPSIWSWRVR